MQEKVYDQINCGRSSLLWRLESVSETLVLDGKLKDISSSENMISEYIFMSNLCASFFLISFCDEETCMCVQLLLKLLCCAAKCAGAVLAQSLCVYDEYGMSINMKRFCRLFYL